MDRCCRDSIRWEALTPKEGTEILCRWCDRLLRFVNGAWTEAVGGSAHGRTA